MIIAGRFPYSPSIPWNPDESAASFPLSDDLSPKRLRSPLCPLSPSVIAPTAMDSSGRWFSKVCVFDRFIGDLSGMKIVAASTSAPRD
jgi:hypothetical protein